ncbi:MAG: hypothetical protein U9O54_05515 [Chloroflexota bacterium]|nr:hypothetical protein [Chloroflexota bacterium]
MKDLFDRNDWLMMGAAFMALIVVLAWRTIKGGAPQVLGADAPSNRGLSLLIWAGIGLGLIVLLVVGGFIFVRARRSRLEKQHQADIDQIVAEGPTIKLLPRSDARRVDPNKINLWERLADALPHDEHISFEIGGSEEGLEFCMHGSENGVRAALTQVRSEWPGVQQRNVDTVDDSAQLPDGWHLWWCECAPESWNKPITPLSDDPLRAVFFELKGVMGRGRGLLQVIARNDFGTRKALGEQAFAAHAERPENAGVRVIRKREAREYEKRAERSFLQATIRTIGMADTPERAQGIARGLARSITASFGHSNPVKRVQEGQSPDAVLTRQMGQAKAWGGHELAYLAHLTGEDMLGVAPRLVVASARSLPADPEMRATPVDNVAAFEGN